MIRLLAILLTAALVAFGIAWMASQPGTLLLTVGNYEIHTSAAAMLGMGLALLVVLFFALRVFGLILNGPGAFEGRMHHWRERKAYEVLSRGLIAAAAGDAEAARRFARHSEHFLAGTPLGLLLKAQAAQLDDDPERQIAIYRAMLEHSDTEILALRGLFDQALQRGDEGEALTYAERAYALRPKTGWAGQALFDLCVRRGEWHKAHALLKEAARAKLVDSAAAKRRRAVLLTAEALDADRRGERELARERSLTAVKLSPSLAPAAVLAARLLIRKGGLWRAQDVIEEAWTQAPHPDLAAAYAALRPKEDQLARGRRLRALANLNPDHFESRLLTAEQAIIQERFAEARKVLAPLASFATARVCAQMADIAEREHDTAATQGWLSRLVHAPRDAQWRCSHCGWESPQWGASCPQCAAFDSLEWTAPSLETIEKIASDAIAALAAQAQPGAGAPSFRRPGTSDPVPAPRPPDDPGPRQRHEDEHEPALAGPPPRDASKRRA